MLGVRGVHARDVDEVGDHGARRGLGTGPGAVVQRRTDGVGAVTEVGILLRATREARVRGLRAARDAFYQGEIAERIDITLANLSILKTGKARAIRFSTLEAICEVLKCQPGDLLEFEPGVRADEQDAA